MNLLPKRPAYTPADCARRGLFKSALYGACVMSAWAASTSIEVERVPLDRRDIPPIVSTTEALMDKHDCWFGDAPSDVTVPGHVVVTLLGEIEPTYRGERMTAAALNQIFADGPTIGEVHGFCR